MKPDHELRRASLAACLSFLYPELSEDDCRTVVLAVAHAAELKT